MESPEFIDSEKGLIALCEKLNKCNWFALDTEFIREKTYYPKLCLIQVATPNVIACVDTLALKSLSPLIDILSERGKTKVFHAAYQDLEIFFRLCGKIPRPLFDTQIAASLLGYGDQIGYASLVDEILDISLDKTHTRTDWRVRPLDRLQLQYAADDVRYLRHLYIEFSAKLTDTNRLEWFHEDMDNLFNESVFSNSLNDAWKRVRGSKRLTPQQLSVLQKLAVWREQHAMMSNRPRRWILSDATLVNLARHPPADLDSLSAIQGISQKYCKRHGERLLDTVRVALSTPRAHWPMPPSRHAPNSRQEALTEEMMNLVRQRAADLNISPNAITSRNQLLKLAMGERDVSVMRGWRMEVVGKLLQKLMDQSRNRNSSSIKLT